MSAVVLLRVHWKLPLESTGIKHGHHEPSCHYRELLLLHHHHYSICINTKVNVLSPTCTAKANIFYLGWSANFKISTLYWLQCQVYRWLVHWFHHFQLKKIMKRMKSRLDFILFIICLPLVHHSLKQTPALRRRWWRRETCDWHPHQ